MRRFAKPVSFIILLSVFVLTGQGCLPGSNPPAQLPSVELDYWRVFDGPDTFDPVISAYRRQHPNVKINYRKLRFDEYEDELIRAFAAGQGPDLFTVHNTWMHEFQPYMLPMPTSVTIVTQEQQGTVRKQVVNVSVEKPTMSFKKLEDTFVEAVPGDVILSYQPDPRQDAEDRIYGLPFSVDSLALFYNKDLLDAVGIAQPPATWEEFQEDVIKLTVLNESGEIAQSGAAIGTSENVERSTDILTLLMLQTGTQMTDERGRISFNTVPEDAPEGSFPALNALDFYTQFASPTKEAYTWNETFPNSFEAFTNGDTAFFLGYSYHTPLIRTTAPKLNFGIAQAPQIANSREVNFANYWVEAVSAQTEAPDWAWDFLQFAAEEENVAPFLEEAVKPTALRSYIDDQIDNEDIGPFAEQLLTAESWYQGRDIDATEEALKQLIDDVLNATYEDPAEALDLAAQKVAQTY